MQEMDKAPTQLKGHQIIGELRRKLSLCSTTSDALKGHQIIGELRQH